MSGILNQQEHIDLQIARHNLPAKRNVPDNLSGTLKFWVVRQPLVRQ
jgi:hypothetical protein